MQHLEVSGAVVIYIGRTVSKGGDRVLACLVVANCRMLSRLIQEQNSSKLPTESFNTYACIGEVMCSRLLRLLGHKSLNSTPCHLTKEYGIAFCF
jgi:hypothetical protein